MGNYSVPEEIRTQRPKGTIVKAISGKYYVYETTAEKREDGKWHTKSGKCIGKIDPEVGFVSNEGSLRTEEVLALDFGEWALSLANSKETFSMLCKHFAFDDAKRIYACALIHFVCGFTYLRDIASHYETSVLSLYFPGLKLGYDAMTKLYDDLGRKQKPVIDFEEALIKNSSSQIAIDGHAIAGRSLNSNLAEKGHKFFKFGQEQMNLLLAYDINSGRPLMSRIYEGGAADKIAVKDFTSQVEFHDTLFVVDRGFYSEENLSLFTENGCHYIIPLAKHLKTCKQATKDITATSFPERFLWERGKKSCVVEYDDKIIEDKRVIVYRDVNEAAIMQANYLRHMKRGDKNYTQASYDEIKDLLAVYVLQTSIQDKTPEQIWGLYKNRWTIETYFDYFKNTQDVCALQMQDYYKLQGLAFIMLVSGLIHREVVKALEEGDVGMSLPEMLLEAKKVKTIKRANRWIVCNCKKKRVVLFEKMNTGLEVTVYSRP